MSGLQLTYYGNGPIMKEVINAVASVLTSDDYGTLIQLVLVLAGLFMLKGWHSDTSKGTPGFHGFSMSMLVMMVLYFGAFVPRTHLVIWDPISAPTGGGVLATNKLPLGVALTLWTSNQIENGLAELFDTGFTSSNFPDQFDYENTGGVPASILSISALGDVYPPNSYLLMSIEDYLKNCWYTASVLHQVNYDAIYESSNILQTLGTVNLPSGWTTTYYDSAGNSANVNCTAAYNDITNDVDNATKVGGATRVGILTELKQLIGQSNDTNDSSGIVGTTGGGTLLEDAAKYQLNAGLSAQSLLAQSMLINSLNPALSNFASIHGLNSESLGSALTESALQTTTTMTTSYALASVFLPMAFLVVNSLVVALLPLVFALMFVPALTRKYGLMGFDLFMWIAFWGPVASVINFIVQAYGSYSFQNGLNGNGITFATMPYLMQHSQTLMAIAGDLMFSVPLIAFALASGSAYAMTAVAGSVAGLSRSAASMGASRMSTTSGAMTQISNAQGLEQTGAMEQNGILPSDAYLGSADAAAANTAMMMKYIKTGGFTNVVEGSLYNELYNMNKGIGMGPNGAPMAGTVAGQEIVGGAKAMEKIAGMNNMSIEHLVDLTKQMSTSSQLGNAKAYNNNPELAEEMSAMNTLQNIRQNKGFVELMKAGNMLPKNFDTLSAPEQIKALANGMSQLGAGLREVYLNAQQAQEIFHNPNMGAGTYTVGFDKNGDMVQVVGKGGADIFQVTPQGREQTDSMVSGQTVGPSVFKTITSGWKNDIYGRTIIDKRNKYLYGSETTTGNKYTRDDSFTTISGKHGIQYLDADDIYLGPRFYGPSANAPQTQNILLPETKANQPLIQRSIAQLEAMTHSPNGYANASQAITDAVNKIAPFDMKLAQLLKGEGSAQLKGYLKTEAGFKMFGDGATGGVEASLAANLSQAAVNEASTVSKQVQQNFQSGLNTILQRGDVNSAVNYARAYADYVKSGQLDKAIKMTNQFVPERDRVQMPNMANAVKQEVEYYKQETQKTLNEIKGNL